MKKLILKAVLLAAMATLTGAAQAVLTDQGNGTVLDTNTNLIWLQDWEVNGRGNWATQKTWAEGLTFAGGTDWVLPSILCWSNFHGHRVGGIHLDGKHDQEATKDV